MKFRDKYQSKIHIDMPIEELQRRWFNITTEDAYEYFLDKRNFFHENYLPYGEEKFNEMLDKFELSLQAMDEKNNEHFNVFMVEDDELREQLIETMQTDRSIITALEYGKLIEPLDLYHHPENFPSPEQRAEIRAKAEQIVREREKNEG